MRTATRRAAAVLWIMLAGLLFARPAAAHQEDTSYTRIRIDGDRVTTEATFDLHVLGRIAPVDGDGDGTITPAELTAIAPVIQEYLGSRIELRLDDGAPDLGTPLAPVWAEDVALVRSVDWPQTLVDFPFTREIEAHPELLTLEYSTWPELGPSHTNLTSIAQAGYDEVEIVFTEAEPDFDYFTEAPASAWSQFRQFMRLGAEHIWSGLDHILFLAALLVASRLREMIQIVTAFTVAHSITLALAVLDVVELPPRLIEASIAATIVWVAVDNLRPGGGTHRWRLTFVFGLVHGFGFAGVLRELAIPPAALLRSLAGFNVGVELGQLAIVAILFPLFALVQRTRAGPAAATTISAAVAVAGMIWFVERVFF